MRMIRNAALIAAFVAAGGGWALAAASEWTTVEGGAVRVVLSAEPDEAGRLRGALQVDLKPGWKTYWLDPGTAGVPPTVEVTAQGKPGEVEIGFPPPDRFDDGYAVWAGYDRPVSLALTITPPPSAEAMEFSIFLGVCETICIPVQSTFTIVPDGANLRQEAIVEQAFAALPQPARAGFRILAAHQDGESLVLEAEAPAGEAALFLASTENRMFGTPTASEEDGRTTFRVPVLSPSPAQPEEARYTLVSGDEAVAGSIRIGE